MSVYKHISTIVILSSVFGAWPATDVPAAYAHHETEVPLNETAMVNGINTMCTGTGLSSRIEATMNDFPLRVEMTGKSGQYLGDQIVKISGANIDGELAVHCAGPWVLFDVPAGQYSVTSFAGHNGPAKTSSVDVSGEVQDRVVLNFPELGGAVSAQQEAAVVGY